MKKRAKSGVLATSIITAVLIGLLSVITFAVPFNRLSLVSHYLNFGLACFVLLAQAVIFAITMFGEKDAKQRVMGLPIIYTGFVALGFQLIVSAIFFLANAFVELAPWIVIVVEAVVIAYLTISVTKGFFFKSHSKTFSETEFKTQFMDDFRARLKAMCAVNSIDGISKTLEDLYETARGSDPISNEKTMESEAELLSLLQELDSAIKAGNESDSRSILVKMKNTLSERNALCKTGK